MFPRGKLTLMAMVLLAMLLGCLPRTNADDNDYQAPPKLPNALLRSFSSAEDCHCGLMRGVCPCRPGTSAHYCQCRGSREYCPCEHHHLDTPQAIIISPYTDLSRYLTRHTLSKELEENTKIVKQLLKFVSSQSKQLNPAFKQLAQAFADLQPNRADDSNHTRLCSNQNLANLRILVEAMQSSLYWPPLEDKRRLNTLVIELTGDVSSFCSETLREQTAAEV